MNKFLKNMEEVLKLLEDVVDSAKNADAFDNLSFAIVKWVQTTHSGFINLISSSNMPIVGSCLKEFGEPICKDFFNFKIDKSYIKFNVIPAIKEFLKSDMDGFFASDFNLNFSFSKYSNFFTISIVAYTVLFIYICNEEESSDVSLDYKMVIHPHLPQLTGERLLKYIGYLGTETSQILNEHFFLKYNYSFSFGFSFYDFMKECLEETAKLANDCITYVACDSIFILGDFPFLENYKKVVFNKLRTLGILGYY